ncbi:MAG: hypothetical protein F6K14_10405 [Symploca sp. SIO2C1]|nr:hypothetical protein [Symploca sp. SIO2C1]
MFCSNQIWYHLFPLCGTRQKFATSYSFFPSKVPQIPIPNSQFPIPNSQFPIPNSPFP